MSKSKQINFFITQNDLKDIELFFKQHNCIVIRNNVISPDSAFGYDIVMNKEKIFQVFLSKEEFKGSIKFKYVDNQKYYYVDVLTSNVIEFGIGGFYPYSDKELHRSRFYFIYEYYNNNKLIEKTSEFTLWADNIFKSFKKQFLKRDAKYSKDFLSESFINWIEDNDAKLELSGQKFIKQ